MRTALPIEAWDRFKTIRSDNGAELVCGDVRQRAKARGSRWHYIKPGQPTQNSHIESGSRKLRDECLNRNLWRDIAEVRRETEQYKTEHNTEHPYQALRYLTHRLRTIGSFKQQINQQRTNVLPMLGKPQDSHSPWIKHWGRVKRGCWSGCQESRLFPRLCSIRSA